MSTKQHELIRTLREDWQGFQGQLNHCFVPVFVGNQNLCRIHNPHNKPCVVDYLDSTRELNDI
jgi:hypothetical protein